MDEYRNIKRKIQTKEQERNLLPLREVSEILE